MKRLLSYLLLSLSLFSGCSSGLYNNPAFQPVLSSFKEVTQKYKYREDSPGNDYWQSPDETRKRRKGDCEDLAVLLHDELREKGIESQLVVGNAFYLELERDKISHHVWCEVEINGRTYIADPSLKHFLPKDILDPKTNAILARKGNRQSAYIEISRKYGDFILKYIKDREKLRSMKKD